jgi:hypothetical protein
MIKGITKYIVENHSKDVLEEIMHIAKESNEPILHEAISTALMVVHHNKVKDNFTLAKYIKSIKEIKGD